MPRHYDFMSEISGGFPAARVGSLKQITCKILQLDVAS